MSKSDSYEIVDSKPEHIKELANNLRDADRKELWLMGLRSYKGVKFCYDRSMFRKTALVKKCVLSSIPRQATSTLWTMGKR